MMKVVFAASTFCLLCVLFSCRKSTTTTSPVPDPPAPPVVTKADTEIVSALDVAFASGVANDFMLMAGFFADNNYKHFFKNVPGTVQNLNDTMSVKRNEVARQITVIFKQTKCLDGKLRDGVLVLDFNYDPQAMPAQGAGSRFFREAGFGCKLTLTNFKTGEWLISTEGNQPATLLNTVSSAAFDPTKENLTWKLKGHFRFVLASNPNVTLTWNGELVKSLDNTASPAAFAPTKTQPVNWVSAKTSYTVSATGTLNNASTYTLSTEPTKPLRRDFQCALPIAFTPTPPKPEFHPIVDGILTLRLSTTNYLRNIVYGTLEESQAPCNNQGLIATNLLVLPATFR